MELDCHLLDDAELLIEFEVRGLSDKANRGITDTLKEALSRRLEEERDDSCLIPTRPHEAARKSPQRESDSCRQLLESFRNGVLQELEKEEQISAWLPMARSKLAHVRGRIYRANFTSEAFRDYAKGLEGKSKLCGEWLAKLKTGKLTAEQVQENLKGVTFDSAGIRIEASAETTAGPSGKILEPKPRTEPIDQDQHHEGLEEVLQELGLEDSNTFPSSNRLGERSAPQHFSSPTQGARNSFDLRRTVGGWKVCFSGLNSAISVHQFLVRVEYHAASLRVPCDQLVAVMDLCLEGEALSWFWTIITRSPNQTWKEFRSKLLLRFASAHSDEDVLQKLNSRKQRFPKENIQEYYQAMQALALQSSTTLSDGLLYVIIRRNMRPGLQMSLHNRHFKTLTDLVIECSSLENMWRRVGYYPETQLTYPEETYPYRGSRSSARPQVRFETRNPRVHELNSFYTDQGKYLPDQVSPREEEEYWRYEEGPDDDYHEVCAMAAPLRNRGQSPRSQHLRENLRFSQNAQRRSDSPGPSSIDNDPVPCFNCNSVTHHFLDCKQFVRGVFCYGCGRRGIYRPDCQKCNPQKNTREELGSSREPHLRRPNPETRHPQTTEEAASNTDPELYRNWRR